MQDKYQLAHCYYEAGDYEKARLLFEDLTNNHPLVRTFWVGLAASAQMVEAYPQALTAWSMAAVMDEKDPLPHFHAGEILISLGEIDQAKKALSLAKKSADISLLNKIEVLEERW